MKPSLALLLLPAAILLPARAQQPVPQAHYEGFQLIPVDGSIPPDPEVEQLLAPLRKEMEAKFGRVLCQAPQGLLKGRGDANAVGFWMADVLRARAEAILGQPVQACILNSGGVRAGFRPGKVSIGDIYQVMPFENRLAVIELKGADLVRCIREGLTSRQGEPVSGVKAVVSGSVEKPECVVTWADGSPIDPEAIVRVATSDYLATSGDTMPSLRRGRKVTVLEPTLRQVLLDACEALGQRKQELLPPPPGRYRIPEAMQDAFRDEKVKL